MTELIYFRTGESMEPIKPAGHVSLEQMLAEYRVCVNDPKAVLPQEIIDRYYLIHKTENGKA